MRRCNRTQVRAPSWRAGGENNQHIPWSQSLLPVRGCSLVSGMSPLSFTLQLLVSFGRGRSSKDFTDVWPVVSRDHTLLSASILEEDSRPTMEDMSTGVHSIILAGGESKSPLAMYRAVAATPFGEFLGFAYAIQLLVVSVEPIPCAARRRHLQDGRCPNQQLHAFWNHENVRSL